ncbi:MAG: hypothetical protein JNK66_02880 [Chitinophagales bacterium]|nr:hypothetical protein [Chitinophagales bacterium]
MPDTILVPTDFQVESLNTVKLTLEQTSTLIYIVLVYPMYPSGSITDLLFYSPGKLIRQSVSEEFTSALEILKNRFESRLGGIRTELFHGSTNNAFKNFIEGQGITHIAIPKTYVLKTGKDSFNLLPFIKRCGTPCTMLDWPPFQHHLTPSQQLQTLFI